MFPNQSAFAHHSGWLMDEGVNKLCAAGDQCLWTSFAASQAVQSTQVHKDRVGIFGISCDNFAVHLSWKSTVLLLNVQRPKIKQINKTKAEKVCYGLVTWYLISSHLHVIH